MKVQSRVQGGLRSGSTGGFLLTYGENTFAPGSVTRQERDYIDTMVKASLAMIIEDDPPADVIPIDRAKRAAAGELTRVSESAPTPPTSATAPRKKPMKRRTARS